VAGTDFLSGIILRNKPITAEEAKDVLSAIEATIPKSDQNKASEAFE
jgi:hypothetical protein